MGGSGIPKQAEGVVQVLLVNTQFQRLRERDKCLQPGASKECRNMFIWRRITKSIETAIIIAFREQ